MPRPISERPACVKGWGPPFPRLKGWRRLVSLLKVRRDLSTCDALVDDDRNILTSVSIALQAEGFATRVYSDGEAALKALVDNPPDLAVLDLKMPKMDGMELLRHLREKG